MASATGALSGAASGAALGSVVPGVGTLIGGAVGGLAGLFGAGGSSSKSLGDLSPSGQNAQGYIDELLKQQYGMLGAGPGQSDVAGAYQSSLDLAKLFQQYAQNGGLPNQQQTDYAGGVANNLYAGQQAQLNNTFTQQRTDANRSAAALGRAPNDPILLAKLAQAQSQQQQVLSGQQRGTAQELALALPGQQLGYAMQGNQLLQGLASQAFSNRAAILGQGQQLVNTERAVTSNTSTQLGGGFGGALSGFVGGAAAGTNNSFLNNLFSGAQKPAFGG